MVISLLIISNRHWVLPPRPMGASPWTSCCICCCDSWWAFCCYWACCCCFWRCCCMSIITCYNPDSWRRVLQEQWCIGNFATLTAMLYWKLRHSYLFSEIVSIDHYSKDTLGTQILLTIIRVWEYRIEYRPDTYLDTFFVSFHCICIRKVSIEMNRQYDTFFYFTLHAFSTTVKGKGFNYLSVYKSW